MEQVYVEGTGVMIVDVNYLRYLNEQRLAINQTPLEDIVWMENGQMIEVSDKLIEDFRFTGLSNVDLILAGYYELEKK